MHLVVDGRMWENDSFSTINRNLVAALHRLGYDVRVDAWKQGLDKGHEFIDKALIQHLDTLPKDYDDAVVIRQSWPVCEPYYSPHYNWDNIPGKFKVGLLPWESDHVPKRWLKNMESIGAIIAISPFSAERLETELRANDVQTTVWGIPLGVDRRLFHSLAEPWDFSKYSDRVKKFKFLHVGVGQPRKGSDLLREAYFTEFTDQDDVSLIVKTGGWDSIDAWVPPPGGPHVVVIHDDNIPESALGGLYTACDCLVHPSRLEGFGLTMLEALSCGTLVICPEEGAHRVFADDSSCLLVPGEEEQMPFFEDLMTTAYRVNSGHLAATMRDAVNEAPWDDKIGPGLKTATRYSWKEMAQRIAWLIESKFNVQLREL